MAKVKKDPKRIAAGKKAYATRLKKHPDTVAKFHGAGGKATGGQFDKDQELAKAAGSKGGRVSRRSVKTETTLHIDTLPDGTELHVAYMEDSKDVN